MLKKNKLPILLLAVVAMLSVFYIYANGQGVLDANDPDADGLIPGDSVHPVLAEQRLRLLQQRTEEILELEAAIASGDLSNEEIAVNVSKIDSIHNLKIQEAALEEEILRRFRFEEVLVEVVLNEVLVDVVVNQGEELDSFDLATIDALAYEIFDQARTVLTPIFRD